MSHDDAHHDPHLAHHFATRQQQFATAKLGMWLFLATEILMFSGLFVAYAVYRNLHPDVFVIGAQYLDTSWGATNTVVLLVSSGTVAWAVRAAQLGQKSILIGTLIVTMLCALGFMGIKYVEYSHKFEVGLGPGSFYEPAEELILPEGEPVVEGGHEAHEAHHDSRHEATHADTHHPQFSREQLTTARPFFGIYFALTGLHGLHVTIGIGLMLWLLIRATRNQFGPDYFTPVELVALYWHLVDLIWIYLFPLLYLID